MRMEVAPTNEATLGATPFFINDRVPLTLSIDYRGLLVALRFTGPGTNLRQYFEGNALFKVAHQLPHEQTAVAH